MVHEEQDKENLAVARNYNKKRITRVYRKYTERLEFELELVCVCVCVCV